MPAPVLLLDRALVPGQCPSGFVYYTCHGFKGCCSVSPCDSKNGVCPAGMGWPGLSSIGSSAKTTPADSVASTTLLRTPTPIKPTLQFTTARPTTIAPTLTASGNPAATSLASTHADVTTSRAAPGFSTAAIAGLAVCGLLLCVCIGLLVCLLRRRRRQRQRGPFSPRPSDAGAREATQLPRRPSQESMATLAEMSIMDEEARRVAGKVLDKRRSVHPPSGMIENPRGGPFEELGGRYYSPVPAGDRRSGSRRDSSTSVRSHSSASSRDSDAGSGLVSPLTPNPAHRFSAHRFSAVVPELDGKTLAVELESPISPTFGRNLLGPATTLSGGTQWKVTEVDILPVWRGSERTDAVMVSQAAAWGPEKPRATLDLTKQERSRGEHVASWGYYDMTDTTASG